MLDIMAQLRDPQSGCPWDVKQNFASIAPHTLEEAYEVVDAIERGDMPHLREELGDLLLQVVFHSQMAREEGHFDFAQVVDSLCRKLVDRHPHVFGDAVVASAEEQEAAWNAIKQQEKQAKRARQTDDAPAASVLDDVPRALPALTRAATLQKRAASLGFDWPQAAPVIAKIREELEELEEAVRTAPQGATSPEMREELGDFLFACVNLARHMRIDAEEALRAANHKFERRFRHVERRLGAQPGATLEEMDFWWEEAKAQEKA